MDSKHHHSFLPSTQVRFFLVPESSMNTFSLCTTAAINNLTSQLSPYLLDVCDLDSKAVEQDFRSNVSALLTLGVGGTFIKDNRYAHIRAPLAISPHLNILCLSLRLLVFNQRSRSALCLTIFCSIYPLLRFGFFFYDVTEFLGFL